MLRQEEDPLSSLKEKDLDDFVSSLTEIELDFFGSATDPTALGGRWGGMNIYNVYSGGDSIYGREGDYY